MAELSIADKQALHKGIMSDLSSDREGLALTKSELRAAIDALDTYMNDNAVAINSIIPLPARSVLTASQKAELLSVIVKRRWEVS